MNGVYAQYVNDSGNIDYNYTRTCIRFQGSDMGGTNILYWNVDPGVSSFNDNVTKFKLIAFLRQQ